MFEFCFGWAMRVVPVEEKINRKNKSALRIIKRSLQFFYKMANKDLTYSSIKRGGVQFNALNYEYFY
ncbi:hypothetical protein MYP_1025 [Sporocytophaga myxococcoides]|uniref:Uncharacterized protein n=1 Tax=Sporocytophaga myxococcoides TaxID=153721 RepID=A0A098LBL4_9BACT|nr:hypothetical protein MYP_1025 [Sporocytophaga myxococcoides]